MNAAEVLFALAAAALAVLGVRSLMALDGRAPWTRAGWAASTVYCGVVVTRLLAHLPPLPMHGEYALLALMVLAFVVAGLRREPQAEPWWWPARATSSRV